MVNANEVQTFGVCSHLHYDRINSLAALFGFDFINLKHRWITEENGFELLNVLLHLGLDISEELDHLIHWNWLKHEN